MNFIFISPNYPPGHWKYVSALCNSGINVLGIGDAGYETFPAILKGSMTEYYRVGDLHDYDAVYRACAFFIHKYGRIDFIESLNPYWRDLEAELRYDFRISGLSRENLRVVLNRSKAYDCAENSGVSAIPHRKLASLNAAVRFGKKYGWPVTAVPIENKRLPVIVIDEDSVTEPLLSDKIKQGYLLCAVPKGEYVSCDGVADDTNAAIICAVSEFEQSPEKTAENNSLLAFRTVPDNKKMNNICSALLKAYNIGRGFFHFDFVRLSDNADGIGSKGDYVLVKAEFNPPPEYIADAICCAEGIDIYALWAMLATGAEAKEISAEKGVAGFASRRFDRSYVNSHEDILNRLGAKLCIHGHTDGFGCDVTGDYIYIFRGRTEAEAKKYTAYIQEG